MKSTIKVFLTYLFGAMFLIISRNLIPALANKWQIVEAGKYRMLCLMFFVGLGISILLFFLLKKKDSEVKDFSDICREEDVNPYAVAIPGKHCEICYQPVTYKTVLGICGVLCLLRILLLDPSLNREALLGDMDIRGLFWMSMWLIIACPIAEGILYRGLLQKNLMKFGAVYAILFTAVARWLSWMGCASEWGAILYAVFYGVLAARYSLSLSIRVEMIHGFFYVLPSLLPIRIFFKKSGIMVSIAGLLDKIAILGTGLFIVYLLVKGVLWILKYASSEETELQFSKSTALLRADGTMTILFLMGFYLLERTAENLTMLLYIGR